MTHDPGTQGDPFAGLEASPGERSDALHGCGELLRSERGRKYRVLETRGGGMGTVYICAMEGSRSDDRMRVALKTHHRSRLFDLASQNAFRSEVMVWMRLTGSPYVLPAFDVEKIEGQYHVVMLAVEPGPEGEVSVADLLRTRSAPLPPEEAFRWAFQAIFAMAQAQKMVPGLVHGDLKPGNLLLLNGEAFLSDFGLARVIQTAQKEPGQLAGTLAYQAPELWADGTVSEKTDIYAFGVMLYQMVTGTLPFTASSPAEWREAHRLASRAAPDGWAADSFARELMELAVVCMSRDPMQRPDDFTSLMRRMAGVGDRHARPVVAEVLMLAAGMGAATTDVEASFLRRNRLRTLLELDEIDELLAEFASMAPEDLDDELRMMHGTALSLAGRPDESNAIFEAILATTPADAVRLHCISEMALNLKRLGQYDRAEELFEALLLEVPDEDLQDVTANLSTVYIEKGDSEKAVSLLKPLLLNQPDFAGGWANLGTALSRVGRHTEAVSAFQRALFLDPAMSQVRIWLAAELMDHFHDFPAALASLDLAYQQGYHSREWWLRTWSVNMLLGRNDDAAGLLAALDRPEVPEEIRNSLVREAVDLLGTFVEHAPERDEGVPADLPAATESEPASVDEPAAPRPAAPRPAGRRPPRLGHAADGLRRVGSFLRRMWRPRRLKRRTEEEAKRSEFSLPFINTRFYLPTNTAALDYYDDFAREGWPDELKRAWRVVKRQQLGLFPGMTLRPTPFYFARCTECGQLILTNRDEGESLNCRACGTKHRTTRTDEPGCDAWLTAANEALGLKQEPLSSHQVILAIWSRDPEQGARIVTLCEAKKLEEVPPGSPVTQIMTMLARQRGLFHDNPPLFVAWRIPLSAKEVAINGQTPPTVDRLIRELRTEVGQFISVSFIINPAATDLITLTVLGRHDEVEDALRERLRRDPSDEVAHEALIGYLRSRSRAEEASRECGRAVALHPQNARLLRMAGMLAADRGDLAGAVLSLEKAMRQDPADPITKAHLASCYRAQGRVELAEQTLAAARATGRPF